MKQKSEENCFNVNMSVDVEVIKNLFSCAIEGGSTYWCEKIRPLSTDDEREYEDYMLDGFYLWEEESSDDKSRKKKVTKSKIEKALQIMATKYPKHFKDALDESRVDADTGDVFLQLCAFGKIVYG